MFGFVLIFSVGGFFSIYFGGGGFLLLGQSIKMEIRLGGFLFVKEDIVFFGLIF